MKKAALVLIFMLGCATLVAAYPAANAAWQPEARDEERERLLELLVLKAELNELAHPMKKNNIAKRVEEIILELKKDTIAERVKKIVVEQLGVDEAQVKAEASFVDDLGADSLDTVEMVMALEEEFDTEIPDEDAEQIQTVQQAIDYISKNQ